MVLWFANFTLFVVANFTLICNQFITAHNPNTSLPTQEGLEQRENENENAIANKHGSVVHTAEDIDGQEAKETIHDPNYHDEDWEGKTFCLLFPLSNCKNNTNFHQSWFYDLQN